MQLYILGKYQPLNNTVIRYRNRLRSLRKAVQGSGRIFKRSHELLFLTLSEAFRRLEQDRNADLTDLHVLETVHKAHKVLGLDPEDVPHLDVSRRWEGRTTWDGIDWLNEQRADRVRSNR